MIAFRRAAFVLVLVLVATASGPAFAIASQCLAMARLSPSIHAVRLAPASLGSDEVRIKYVTHSTFLIESAGGIQIATDYAGYAGRGVIPDVVTMNHAHSTHYTDTPDPAIEHVLRGWNPQGGPARHDLEVGDVRIRNVSTDIRGGWGIMRVEPDGNSIFIFEVAGLCIGHLGHLHHRLGPEHRGLIGRLDIVMVPVDGSYTMNQKDMAETVRELRARLILPMHAFGPATLAAFLKGMGEEFRIEMNETDTIVVSLATLPDEPTVRVLPGR